MKIYSVFLAPFLVAYAGASGTRCFETGLGHVRMDLDSFKVGPAHRVDGNRDEFKLEISGHVESEFDAAKITVESRSVGVLLSHETYDVCELTACPVQKGALSLDLTISQPSGLPRSLLTSTKVVFSTDDSLEVLDCATFDWAPPADKMLRSEPAGVAYLEEATYLFKEWVREHKWVPANADETTRAAMVFMTNLASILEHNSDETQTYTKALNQFGVMTPAEFKAQMTGGYNGAKVHSDMRVPLLSNNLRAADLPKEIDWSKKGAVTPVKNQGSCGSCWSFSTTGAMEGAYFVKNNKLVSFSEQELVSCDPVDQGCNGGLMDNAFQWIEKQGGLCTEDNYPYVSAEGNNPSCSIKCTPVNGSKPLKYVDTPPTSVGLQTGVAQQPVAVAIEADQMAFQFYNKGVLTGTCGKNLDHGVLAVGYGTLDKNDYWKVKNSWGPSWGMDGFILIQRNKNVKGGQCGILMSASYPVF